MNPKPGKRIARGVLAAMLLALSFACGSNPPEPEWPPVAAPEVPCTCGTPEAAMLGCAHPTCLAGKNNYANPDCVCGTFAIPR